MKAVILAAGESRRFWPLSEDRHKSLTELMGKPLIYWTIESLQKAKIKDVVIVEGSRREISSTLKKFDFLVDIDFVVQDKPKGTGDALEKAKDLLDDEFIVLNPYHFTSHHFIPLLTEKARRDGASVVLLGRETDEPWNYGILEFDVDKPIGIVEKPHKGEEPSNIRVLGIYYLTKSFFNYHKKYDDQYSFEKALNDMMKSEEASVVITDEKLPTLKYPWHLLDVFKLLAEEFIEKETIHLNANVKENVVIEGKVFIDEGVTVYENSVIRGPTYIGKNTIVGNNSLIRESHIGENSIVGSNIEIARSVLMKNIHSHSGYIGDSIIGENSKIGAGVITANVRLDRKEIHVKIKGEKVNTKRKKLGVILGHNSVVGINVGFMPGTIVGNHCVIGPGAVLKGTFASNSKVYTEIRDGDE